jgi:outer membrane protein assembly factor BamB
MKRAASNFNKGNPVKRATFLCGLLLAGSLVSSPARAENWPFWRGPEMNGISQEKKVPVSWTDTKNVAWKLPLPGKGGSTPIVWGERIFLTSAEGNDLVLLCVSTEGKPVWKRTVAAAVRLVIKYDEANEASASPSTDGQHVYAFVGSGHLACFDFEGKEIWKVDVQERYGKFKIEHGLHTTPLLHEDRLYLSLLHGGGNWVVALDKATGKEVWKIDRKSDAQGESREAYASPCLWRTAKETSVVILGSDYTTAHRLKDGSEIWRLAELNPKAKYSTALRIIATPVAHPDLLVVPTARGGMVAAVKPGASGLITPGSPFELWRTAKGSPDVPSPLIHDGLVYLPRENGVLICLDAQTGKEHYSESLHRDRYRSSPVFADGKIYWTARDGTFSVVKAGPKFELLATNVMGEEVTASPAISGGRLYVRGFRHLYAIQEK